MDGPPPVPPRAWTDDCFGAPYTDPAGRPDPATVAWEDAHNARTAQRLRTHPAYQAIVEDLAASWPTAPRGRPVWAGGHWFRIGSDDVSRSPAVLMGTRVAGDERVVLDRRQLGSDVLLQIVPSPDGRVVACVMASSPSTSPWLRVLSVEDGGRIGEPIRLGGAQHAMPSVAWLPDSSGFYYCAGPARWATTALYFHSLHGRDADRLEPVRIEGVAPGLQVARDGKYVMVLTNSIVAPSASMLRDEDGSWRRFFTGAGERCHGVFVDDAYVAVTTARAPRGRLVSVPLDSGRRQGPWTELVAESECVLWDVLDTGSYLVLVGLDDDRVRFWSVAYDGSSIEELPTPGPGSVGAAGHGRSAGSGAVSVNERDLYLTHQSPTRSEVTYHVRFDARSLQLLEPPAHDLAGLRTWRIAIPVGDGVVVPVQLTARRDLDLTRPQPMVLTGYGALGQADLPGFIGKFRTFVEAGGIHAWATVRGGGEFGDRWRSEGRSRHGAVRVMDFCAVAQGLVDRGMTAADRLMLWGASAGGLLVTSAVASRPDLFGGVVALVPICDLWTLDGYDFGRDVLMPEWGGREGRTGGAHPGEASPFEAFRDDATYPPVLVICADGDDMAPASHARRFVARLSAFSDHVHLRVWRGQGHIETVIGTPSSTAEWMTFLFEHAGLPAPVSAD